MRRRTLALAAAATAAAYFGLRPGDGSSQPPAAGAPARGSRIQPAGPAPRGLVSRARYRLAYEQEVRVPGKAPLIVHADGEWITTPRADGRIEVVLAPASLDGPGVPRRDDLAGGAQLVREGGVLTAIGFPDAMPVPARRLLTGLATALQYTAGEGAEWTASEEDLTGRYDAVYRRTDAGAARSRPRYTAARSADGLAAADGVSPTESTTFEVDAAGVVTAAVELDVQFALGGGLDPARLRLRARLERTAIEEVAPPAGAALAAGPISGFADFAGAQRNADESLVAGATAADLIAEAQRAVAMGGSAGGNARAQAIARIAALVRLDPTAAAQIAEQIRQRPDALAEARLLAGALASTRIAAGTDALAGLLGAELPEAARGAVVGALSLASPVTPASLAALTAGLDQPHAGQAALGLGTHGRKARAADPAAADAAAAQLLDRHARAGSDAERKLYLEALGNAGAPQALPALRAALAGDDRKLASAAAFSLRFVPGADADALVERSIGRPEVALAAIRAAAYRDPARFRPLLLAAQEQYPGHDGIQGEIRAILRRWH